MGEIHKDSQFVALRYQLLPRICQARPRVRTGWESERDTVAEHIWSTPYETQRTHAHAVVMVEIVEVFVNGLRSLQMQHDRKSILFDATLEFLEIADNTRLLRMRRGLEHVSDDLVHKFCRIFLRELPWIEHVPSVVPKGEAVAERSLFRRLGRCHHRENAALHSALPRSRHVNMTPVAAVQKTSSGHVGLLEGVVVSVENEHQIRAALLAVTRLASRVCGSVHTASSILWKSDAMASMVPRLNSSQS